MQEGRDWGSDIWLPKKPGISTDVTYTEASGADVPTKPVKLETRRFSCVGSGEVSSDRETCAEVVTRAYGKFRSDSFSAIWVALVRHFWIIPIRCDCPHPRQIHDALCFADTTVGPYGHFLRMSRPYPCYVVGVEGSLLSVLRIRSTAQYPPL